MMLGKVAVYAIMIDGDCCQHMSSNVKIDITDHVYDNTHGCILGCHLRG